MRFEYEIGVDEYVSGSLVFWELSDRRRRTARALWWTVAGGAAIVIAWTGEPFLRSIVLTLFGALWIYEGGMRNLFPQSYLSRCYKMAELAGKRFTANTNQDGVEITSGSWSWRVPWRGVRLKAEDERVFMIYSFGTMFIFGKKYLTDEQQQELRKFLGLLTE